MLYPHAEKWGDASPPRSPPIDARGHLHRREMVQRSAALSVIKNRRGDQCITTILRQLHWLPVRKRIEYKLLVLVHRAFYDGTPEYLAALLLQHAPPRTI